MAYSLECTIKTLVTVMDKLLPRVATMSHTLLQEGVTEAAMESEIVQCSSLSQVHQDLIQRAIEVKDSAYSRYSHFSVGSAVLTSSGKIYKGTM